MFSVGGYLWSRAASLLYPEVMSSTIVPPHDHLDPTEQHLHVGGERFKITSPSVPNVERGSHSFLVHQLKLSAIVNCITLVPMMCYDNLGDNNW